MNGEPSLHVEGYARYVQQFDNLGNIIEGAFFGIDGRPTLRKDGYARYERKFDKRGNLVETILYGADGGRLQNGQRAQRDAAE